MNILIRGGEFCLPEGKGGAVLRRGRTGGAVEREGKGKRKLSWQLTGKRGEDQMEGAARGGREWISLVMH